MQEPEALPVPLLEKWFQLPVLLRLLGAFSSLGEVGRRAEMGRAV